MLKQWLEKALKMGVDERSDSLAENSEMASAHEECARSGDTDANEKVSHHFICFVNHNGSLYELGKFLCWAKHKKFSLRKETSGHEAAVK